MRTTAQIAEAEAARLEFIRQRDGDAAASAFARQGLIVYRKALAQRTARGARTGYGQAFRHELVVSCLFYRRALVGTRFERNTQ